MTTSSLGTPFLQDAPGPAAEASGIPSGAESSGYVLVPLREGADFTLYRGRQHGKLHAIGHCRQNSPLMVPACVLGLRWRQISGSRPRSARN
jgi:hypothetical protein